MSNVATDTNDDLAPWPASFGERLKLARERAGMSQEVVQGQLGYPIRSLTRWENGRSDPGFEKVARMADFYGVSTDWIAGRTSIEKCIRPGMVMIDNIALEQLAELVAHRKSVRDVPQHLVRKPGINFAVVVPEAPSVVGAEAAESVEARMQALWKQLGGGA